jgi:hypothetical protein
VNRVTHENSPQGTSHIAHSTPAGDGNARVIGYRSRARDSLVSSALALGWSEEGVGRGPTTSPNPGSWEVVDR